MPKLLNTSKFKKKRVKAKEVETILKETIVEKPTIKLVEVPKEIVGKDGKDGSTPDHEIKGSSIRFKKPDGSWGKWLTFPSDSSYFPGDGNPLNIKYTKVETSTYNIKKGMLLNGRNIFGVNYGGAVTITLPDNIDYKKIITIKDESGNCSSNNITVKGVR